MGKTLRFTKESVTLKSIETQSFPVEGAKAPNGIAKAFKLIFIYLNIKDKMDNVAMGNGAKEGRRIDPRSSLRQRRNKNK